LHKRIEDNLNKRGYAKEARKFTPHMTLGRVKNMDGLVTLSEYLSREKFETDEFVVDKMLIMKSDLKPSGAEYTPLYTVQFRKKVEDQ
jgi:2'-5' RNA ligase